jgi:nitrogen fixation NifU-like protein
MAPPSHPEYSDVLLDHFRNPRNVGDVADPDAHAQVESPLHGDRLRLSFRIDGDRIVEARFRCLGCTVAIAAGSVATVLLTGRTIAAALRLTDEDVAEALGGVPERRAQCSLLVRRTVHAALGSRLS